MSLFNRAPRQVYEVHGEDDYLADEGSPNRSVVRDIDATGEGSRSGGVLGLALLVAVTLGAVALVWLHVAHSTPGRQSVAELHVSSNAPRRASPGPLTTAPPEVHPPTYSRRHPRASTTPAARPRRRGKRISGEHAQPPKIVVIGPASDRRSPVRAWAYGEFDFER